MFKRAISSWSLLTLLLPCICLAGANDGSTVVTVYEEHFDAGGAGWTTAGTWEIGRPINGPGTGASPTNCAATDLDASYANNLNDRMLSPGISLPALSNATDTISLKYNQWIYSEAGLDEGITEISTNGGSTWTELKRASGASNSWTETSLDLTAYAGSTVLLGFRFVSDESVRDIGWCIDDVTVLHRTRPYLSGAITSLNSLNFPYIYLNVAVWTNGAFTDILDDPNFTISEDGTEQTKKKEVLKPSEGGGQRLADIVFIMDNSGSMSSAQAAVESNVVEFVDGLLAEGIDFALGLCRNGQSANNGDPIIEDSGILTSDAHYFTNSVWQRNVDDGATEPGYFSLQECTKKFNFRPGAQKVFIIITDETPDQGGASLLESRDSCLAAGATVFALTETNLFYEFTPITDPSNGECFDIYSDFGVILDTIKTYLSQSYLVRYEADDTMADPIARSVEIVVSNAGSTATLTWEYIPRSAPKIMRTDATLAMHNSAYSPGTALPIAVRILDNVEPVTESAKLYYKSTTNSSYSLVEMSNTSGNVWTANIPGSDVQIPGVDYFILATDSETTTSDPSVDPFSARYQFAVSPNVAPAITHTPVTSPALGVTCVVTAQISDATAALDTTMLYYRKTGQLLYQSTNMNNSAGATYLGNIPAAYVTADGIDYYLRAFDDQGVGTYHGTPDAPHQTLLPDIAINPLSFTANLLTGQVTTQSVTVTSQVTGSGPLAFELLAGDNANVGALSFSPMAGFLSTPGSSQPIDIVLDASGLNGGSYNTDIIVLSNDPDNNRIVVTGLLNVTAAPDITLSTAALDFGDIFLGTSSTQILDVTNEGFAQLDVSSLTSDNSDFAPSASSLSVAAGTGTSVNIAFTPSGVGAASGTVTVVSNDPDSPTKTVAVTANVLPPPVMDISPAAFNVTLAAGGSSNGVLTIDNTTGGSDLLFNLVMQGTIIDTHPSDNFGYTWLDSNDTNGPAYQWYDITASGVNGNLTGDDTSFSVSLPFTFSFYGKPKTSVLISANGYITFGSDGGSTGGTIPSADTTDDLIAPLWDDLESGANGTVHTYHDTLTGRFIIQYTDWVPLSGTETLTFQVHICANGEILFYYKEINASVWPSIGIENSAGSDGLLIGGSGYATNGLAARIFPQGSFIDAGARQGLVPAGQQFQIPVSMNAADLPAGTYVRNIVITGNDPFNTQVTVPVTMDVQGIPDIALDPTSVDFGACFVSSVYTNTIRVGNPGSSALSVSGVSSDDANFSPASTSFIVPAGEAYQLDLIFAPTVAGAPASGTLTISSNDPDEPSILVALSGQRLLPPDIDVDTNAITALLHVGETGSCQVVIGNTGVGNLTYSIAIQHSAGTNAQGYTVLDSNDAGGPAYSWTDIAGIGTPTGLAGDDNEISVTLPFTFTYYGQPQTAVKLSSNGLLVFGTDDSTSTGGTVPDPGTPNNVVAPFWDDLHQQTGACYTYHDAANKRFIIQYNNWGSFGGGSTYTFQVQLCENGLIYFYYQSMVGDLSSADIGIENADGTEGISVAASGTTYVQNGLAVRFIPDGQFLSTAATNGTVSAGSSTTIPFALDASFLAFIDYDSQIVITSNDPDEPELRIPLHLDVEGVFVNETYASWETLYWPGGGSGGQNADFDGDGATNIEEWRAGTDPTLADSILSMAGEPNNGDMATGFRLSWPSINGRIYAVEYSESLAGGFVNLATNIAATPPSNEYNATNSAGLGRCFYRISTSKP